MMCLRISQVLYRGGNMSEWTKIKTKASFQNIANFWTKIEM